MLELEHVGKTYADHRVLDDIDLAIEDGQIVSVLGPSGGGKTTLLNILHGSTATSTSSPPAPSTSLDSTSLRLAGGHLMITLFSSSSWTSSSAEIEVRARPHATF